MGLRFFGGDQRVNWSPSLVNSPALCHNRTQVSLITLTTDFGLSDWFVGTMKGVIAGIAPKATVIDVTHDLPAGDLRAGAFALAASYRFFPKNTVHVVVVDPGVGSPRQAMAVRTDNYCFVGPDNGVLSLALSGERIQAAQALTAEAYFLKPVSVTFHGRDIFAPVAAYLSLGTPIRRLGPALKEFARLDWPEPRRQSGKLEGEVVYIDRFGNGITNLSGELLRSSGATRCVIYARRRHWCPVKRFYQAVPPEAPVAVLGSTGFLEIAVNGGSAEARLGLKRGTCLTLV